MKKRVKDFKYLVLATLWILVAFWIAGCSGGGGNDENGNNTDVGSNTISESHIPDEIQGDWEGEASKVLDKDFPDTWVVSFNRVSIAYASIELNIDKSGNLKGTCWMYQINFCQNPLEIGCMPFQLLGGFDMEGVCAYDNGVLNCALNDGTELDGTLNSDGSMELIFLSANDNSPFIWATVNRDIENAPFDVSGEYQGTFSTYAEAFEGTYNATLKISDDTGTITVAMNDPFYNGTVKVKSATREVVVITFDDAEGDEIEATLEVSGYSLKGHWKYSNPIFTAFGFIDVSKAN